MFYELNFFSLKFLNFYVHKIEDENSIINYLIMLGDDDHKNISNTKEKKNHQLILLSRVRKQKSLYTLKKSLKMNPIKIKRLLTQST